MIAYDKFRLSLQRLEEQQENLLHPPAERTRLDEEGVRESVIQRFETCYDCLWKVLRRHLIEGLGVPDPPSSPRPVLRMAGENGLLAAPVTQWIRYAEARVATSHDYDGKKAAACLELVPDFLHDAIGLFRTLTGESWE